jgi:hypothetical protein
MKIYKVSVIHTNPQAISLKHIGTPCMKITNHGLLYFIGLFGKKKEFDYPFIHIFIQI